MKIYEPEIYSYTMNPLVAKGLKRLATEGLEEWGSKKAFCHRTGWAPSRLRSVLTAATPPDLRGRTAIDLPLNSFDGVGYGQAKKKLREAIVKAFRSLEPKMSFREIGRFYRIDDRTVRRYQAEEDAEQRKD